jgi:hypothetical protein
MRALLLVVSIVCATASASAQRTYAGPFTLGTLQSRVVSEASGIACQPDSSSLLWLINDSGDKPQIYAVAPRGDVRFKIRLTNATNVDWEDLALCNSTTPGQYDLYVADIGDNNAKRGNVTIYRASTPHDSIKDLPMDTDGLGVFSDTAEVYAFTYPDGPRDAETFLVDPRTRDFYIISKRDRQARVYRAAAPHRHGTTRTLEFISTLPVSMLTAGDISHDGSMIILKNYLYAWQWERHLNESVADALQRPGMRVAYMPEEQGEAICFTRDDRGYITTSERENGGSNPPLYVYLRSDDARGKMLQHDAKLPSISIAPTPNKPGVLTLRYVVPEVARVSISVVNMILMTMQTVDEDSGEAGVQEREIDVRRLPQGDYAVIVKSNTFTVSVAFTKP